MKVNLRKRWKESKKTIIKVFGVALVAVGIVFFGSLTPKSYAFVKTNTKTFETPIEVKPIRALQSEGLVAASINTTNLKETLMPTVKAKSKKAKVKYVPISKGWKSSKSVKGNITSSQKADLDSMIKSWKKGKLSDSELKAKIESYLSEQNIDYMEVSVTSKAYALYNKIPAIGLKNGSNLYSFFGTYSTGKKNPDGTNKTVCYNWSAYVF